MELKEFIKKDNFDLNNIKKIINNYDVYSNEYKIFAQVLKILNNKKLNNMLKIKEMIAFDIYRNEETDKLLKHYKKHNIIEYINLSDISVFTFKIIADKFWPSTIPKEYLNSNIIINYLKLNNIPNQINLGSGDKTITLKNISIDINKRTQNLNELKDKLKKYDDKNTCYHTCFQESDCKKTMNFATNFTVCQKIGEGSNGNVHYILLKNENDEDEDTEENNDNIFIVKFYNKLNYSKKQLENINRQLELSYYISNFVYKGICPNFNVSLYKFECKNNMPLQILECAHSDLFNVFITKKNKYNITKNSLMFQLLMAIISMHKNNLAHCDLKIENILIIPIKNKKIVYKYNEKYYILKTNYLIQITDYDYVNYIDNKKIKDTNEKSIFFNSPTYFRYYNRLNKNSTKLYTTYDINKQLKKNNNIRLVDYLSLVYFIGDTDLSYFEYNFLNKYSENINKTDTIFNYIQNQCESTDELTITKIEQTNYFNMNLDL